MLALRIMILTLNLRRGGAEKFAILLASGLAHSNHTLQLCSIQGPVEYEDLLARTNQVPLILFNQSAPYFWTNLLAMARRVRAAATAFSADVTLIVGGQALILGWLAGLSEVLYCIQNSNGLHWTGFRPGYFLLRTLEFCAHRRLAPYYVACSASAASAYAQRFRIPAARIEVISNGIDLQVYSPKPQETHSPPMRILSVGTLYSVKNYRMALLGIAHLRDMSANAVYTIVGDGPDLAALRDFAGTLGIADRVTFAGQRRDVPDLMAEADFLWITSRNEGFGLVVAEAMATGLPVLATDVPGLRDVIRNGKTGILVPLDSHVELARQTMAAWNDRRATSSMAANAREYAMAHYSAQGMAGEFERVIKGLVDRHRRIQGS